jgi:hypothetical protein
LLAGSVPPTSGYLEARQSRSGFLADAEVTVLNSFSQPIAQLDIPRTNADANTYNRVISQKENSKPNDSHGNGLDLTQKWLRHLRGASKITVKLCFICKDQKTFSDDDNLLHHMLECHPERVPPREDARAFEKFRETLKLQAVVPSTPRCVDLLLSISVLKAATGD